MSLRYALFSFAFFAINQPVRADEFHTVPYSLLATQLTGRIAFDTMPNRPEPGLSLDHPLTVDGAQVGAGFAGQVHAIRQSRDGTRFDALSDARAQPPLRLIGHGPGQGLAFARHRGFGSVAVFPLGPDGFDRLSGRGEGALAVLFPHDQAAIGLRVHSDYADPLGARARQPGAVEVIAMARDGRVIARHAVQLAQGITEIGLRRAGDIPDIAGFVLLNTDPGGIAVDDILYARTPLLGHAPPLTGPRAARRVPPNKPARLR
jgi:hypothetical protein